MVTTLNIKCPHCEQVSQIFLSTTVCVIILNCPSCLSPVMYFRRKIFLLDPLQLKKITGSSRDSIVFKLLEQMSGVETATPCASKKVAHLHENRYDVSPPQKLTIERVEEKYITEDDCTNLRIDLELCSDSQSFIDRM